MSNDRPFGLVPQVKRIPLTTDADWQFAMKLSEPWPAGVTLTFELDNGTSWEASIDDEWARWHVDKDVTNTVPNGMRWKFFARTTDGVEECWFYGTVIRYDEAA